MMIALIFFGILLYGLLLRKDMYQTFLEGVKEGFQVVLEIAPTLIALFLAVQVFRVSGALEIGIKLCEPLAKIGRFPKEVLPVIFAKMFSSSAATGFLIDLFKTYGPDSVEGMLGSVILSSTETCFYTMSIYFSSVHITKGRWTLAGALLATLAGVVASILLVVV